MAGLRYAPDLLQIRRVTPTRVHLSLQAALVPGACCLVPGNLHSSTLFANEKASKPASRNVCGPDKLTTSRGTAPGSWRSRRCRTGAEKSKKWQLLIQFRALSGHRRIKMPLCKFSIVLVCVCRWSSTSVLLLPLPLATRHLLRLLHFHFIFGCHNLIQIILLWSPSVNPHVSWRKARMRTKTDTRSENLTKLKWKIKGKEGRKLRREDRQR